MTRFTDDAPSDPDKYAQAASRDGVVGHSQTSARARRNGKPLIIRRDFNTVDGGLAGLHFVSIQKTIGDFVTTRNAMNAANASYLNPAITDTVNNGINEFIFVLKRANYIIPSPLTAHSLCFQTEKNWSSRRQAPGEHLVAIQSGSTSRRDVARESSAAACGQLRDPAADAIRDNTSDNIHPFQGVQSVQKTPRFAGLGRQKTHLPGMILG